MRCRILLRAATRRCPRRTVPGREHGSVLDLRGYGISHSDRKTPRGRGMWSGHRVSGRIHPNRVGTRVRTREAAAGHVAASRERCRDRSGGSRSWSVASFAPAWSPKRELVLARIRQTPAAATDEQQQPRGRRRRTSASPPHGARATIAFVSVRDLLATSASARMRSRGDDAADDRVAAMGDGRSTKRMSTSTATRSSTWMACWSRRDLSCFAPTVRHRLGALTLERSPRLSSGRPAVFSLRPIQPRRERVGIRAAWSRYVRFDRGHPSPRPNRTWGACTGEGQGSNPGTTFFSLGLDPGRRSREESQ